MTGRGWDVGCDSSDHEGSRGPHHMCGGGACSPQRACTRSPSRTPPRGSLRIPAPSDSPRTALVAHAARRPAAALHATSAQAAPARRSSVARPYALAAAPAPARRAQGCAQEMVHGARAVDCGGQTRRACRAPRRAAGGGAAAGGGGGCLAGARGAAQGPTWRASPAPERPRRTWRPRPWRPRTSWPTASCSGPLGCSAERRLCPAERAN